MAGERYFYDGEEISEDDALNPDGTIKDGVVARVRLQMRDSAGCRLVDAAGQSLSDLPARRSGYVFADTSAERKLEDRDFEKAKLSAAWKGGLEQGDTLTIGSNRFEVLGWNDRNKVVLADATDADGDELKQAAYNQSKQELSDAWRKKKSPPDEDDDEEEEGKKKKKRSDMEQELAGPLSDEQSVDAATVKREAWEQSCADLRDAWKTRR